MRALLHDLRTAGPCDHDAIADIWHAGAGLPGVGPAAMPARADLRERLEREVAAGWVVTVASQAGSIQGFVAVKPAEAVLAELFVRPDMIGVGVGTALLARAMAQMPDGFTLYTRSANERARRFYERAGLRVIREGLHPRSGDPIVYYAWKPG